MYGWGFQSQQSEGLYIKTLWDCCARVQPKPLRDAFPNVLKALHAHAPQQALLRDTAECQEL